MSSGLKIRIPARHLTPVTVNSGASSSIQPTSSVEDSKFKPEAEINDVDMEGNAEYLPAKKYTTLRGHIRNPPKKWVQWEIDFLEKCFEITQYPKGPLRSEWALILTETRLQNLTRSPEDKENLADIWFAHYKRRLPTWLKHRRTRQRRESEALVEENPEGDEACPVASPSQEPPIHHSVTVIRGITVLNDQCDQEEQYTKEYRQNSPENEEEIDELAGDTLDAGWILDDEVVRKGTKHILAHLHSLLQHPVPKVDPPT